MCVVSLGRVARLARGTYVPQDVPRLIGVQIGRNIFGIGTLLISKKRSQSEYSSHMYTK